MAVLAYTHVDVFSSSPFSGNSLPVFTDAHGLSAEQMLRITQELRHFEAIFLGPTAQPDCVRARVFDLFGELPFAGHPIIGAAAALHHASSHDDTRTWRFELSSRTVTLTTERTHTGFFGLLDQGAAEFFGIVNEREAFAHAFGLDQDDLHPEFSDAPVAVRSAAREWERISRDAVLVCLSIRTSDVLLDRNHDDDDRLRPPDSNVERAVSLVGARIEYEDDNVPELESVR